MTPGMEVATVMVAWVAGVTLGWRLWRAPRRRTWDRLGREARPVPLPLAGVLGVATGESLALTVLVPPDRTLSITGGVYMPDGGRAALKEGEVTLALFQSGPGGALDLETVVRPSMGSHTYRLECSGEVHDSPLHRPFIMVTDVAPRP